MNRLICCIALMLSTLSGLSNAQSTASSKSSPNLFDGKSLAAPHIYVEALSQYVKWGGKPIAQGDYEPAVFVRTRLGTVTFSSDLKVHIDVIRNTVHYPSYYELVDAQSGVVLGKYAVFDPDDAEWYFSGNGIAYLNQTHLSLAGHATPEKSPRKAKHLLR
jgi:hypothetical protein